MGDTQSLRRLGIRSAYGILLTSVFWLAFYQLDNRLFWVDEAETAVLARNILQFGVPKVEDGTNHISLHGDKFDVHDGVWTWTPWLPYYVTAASFKLLGTTTWAGRAPFALIGWLAVVALGFSTWKIYRHHGVALATMALLGTSEVYLLHMRQCRYYSITVLGEILLVYGVFQILNRKQTGLWLVWVGLAMQFFCNYVIALANFPGLCVLIVLLFWRKDRAAWHLVTALGGLLLVGIPWLWFANLFRQYVTDESLPVGGRLAYYLLEVQFDFIPWCVLLLPGLGWLWQRRKKNDPSAVVRKQLPAAPRYLEGFLMILPALYLPVLLVLPSAYARYLLPQLPIMCLLASVWLFRYLPRRMIIALLILIHIGTNALSMVTVFPITAGHHLRVRLVEYVAGLFPPYADVSSTVVEYLQNNSSPGQRLLTFAPEFPLQFYTHLSVIDGRLNPPGDGQLPDWYESRSASAIVQEPVPLPEFMKPYYERVEIPVPDASAAGSIPQPGIYQYQTATDKVLFVIYRLKTSEPTPQKPAAPQ